MSTDEFERRKTDHIRLSLMAQSQARGRRVSLNADASALDSSLDGDLVHEALPDFNFSEIDLSCELLGRAGKRTKLNLPVFISSMTAGHEGAHSINSDLARLSQERGILLGVGSQRRELEDPTAREEWKKIKSESPTALLMGNIGISELVEYGVDPIMKLMEVLDPLAFIVHLNPLQECLQPENPGPKFSGAEVRLLELVERSHVPIVVKEVGCGMSESTIKRLNRIGVDAVDVAGFGGTHWGRIEGERNPEGNLKNRAAKTFQNWGIGLVDSLQNAMNLEMKAEIWASGGIRNGLDVVKCLALGAQKVGVAQGFLKAYYENHGYKGIQDYLDQLEFEMRVALFCSGCRNLAEPKEKRIWQWRRS